MKCTCMHTLACRYIHTYKYICYSPIVEDHQVLSKTQLAFVYSHAYSPIYIYCLNHILYEVTGFNFENLCRKTSESYSNSFFGGGDRKLERGQDKGGWGIPTQILRALST